MSDVKALPDGFVMGAMHAMVEVHSDVRFKEATLLHILHNFVAQALLDSFVKGAMHAMVEVNSDVRFKGVSLLHSVQYFMAQAGSGIYFTAHG
eukprot:gene32542-17259_t